MPKAENAILDPFSAMAPTEAIMVAVCGIVVVFLMLAILALVIRNPDQLQAGQPAGGPEGRARPRAGDKACACRARPRSRRPRGG